MLKLDIKPGESVKIGDYAVITLEAKSGNTARIAIKADRSIPVSRVENVGNAAQMAAKVGLNG